MTFASGAQDWGGRRKDNPPGASRVTGDQVRAYAQQHGIQVRREGPGWSAWHYHDGKEWRVLENTNYLALKRLEVIVEGKTK